MNVFIIGQKWFGAEVFKLCETVGVHVYGVCAPGPGDKLYDLAESDLGQVWDIDFLERDPRYVMYEDVDLIIAAHAHIFVSEHVRETAHFGAISYHPSLLPLHRGRDAIRWACYMRERVTGGTVFWLNNKVDAGPIAAQDWCFIKPDDTPQTLWRRELAPMGLRLLRKTLIDITSGHIVKVPQDEALATWEPTFDRPSLSEAR